MIVMNKYETSANDDGSMDCEDKLVCPYCYAVQEDLFEIDGAYYDSCDNETTCGDCGRDFKFHTRVDYYYSTERIKGE